MKATDTATIKPLAEFGVTKLTTRQGWYEITTEAGTRHQYSPRKSPEGAKFILSDKGLVPVEIAALCAGRDAWLRQIPCKCSECGQRDRIGNMEVSGVGCMMCQPCADTLEAEIAEDNE